MTLTQFALLIAPGVLAAAVAGYAFAMLHKERAAHLQTRLDLTAHLLRLREFNELTHKVDGGNLFAGLRHDGGEKQTFQRRLARAIVKLTDEFRFVDNPNFRR